MSKENPTTLNNPQTRQLNPPSNDGEQQQIPEIIPPGISEWNFRSIGANFPNDDNEQQEHQSGSGPQKRTRQRLYSSSSSTTDSEDGQFIDPPPSTDE
jgi:hypothetical protein